MLSSLVWTPPAHAHWQFTRWGMSPDEVLRAANGRARRIEDDERKPPTPQFLAEGSITLDGREYIVNFAFAEQKLVGVTMRLVDLQQCEAALRELRQRHGTSTSSWADFKQWNKPGEDAVSTSDLSMIDGGYCSIGHWKEGALRPLPVDKAD